MRIGWCLFSAASLTACASVRGPAPVVTDAPSTADTLAVDPVAEHEFDGALQAARWRLLRALDESSADRHDRAREELDQAFYTLAAVDDSPVFDGALGGRNPQAEVDVVAEAVERAYLGVLPHVEHLSPDSPLSLLLSQLAEERVEELPADAVPLVRIHQLAPRCDIPIDANARVAASIHFFQDRGRQTWEAWRRRSGRYRDLIVPILRQEGLPADLFYLAMIESGFNPRAYSRAHAAGLWQFVRSTGRLEGLRIDNFVDERRDPVKSTRAAVRHLQGLYAEFGDWRLATAAYNSGRGRVRRAIDKAGSTDFWQLELPRETRNYVPLLMAAAVIAKDPQRFGFEENPAVDEALVWDQVRLAELIDLKTAARLLETSVERLRNLNPELRKLFTPRRPGGYRFNVPPGSGAGFLAAYNRLPKSEKRGIYEYEVQRGDNLWSIAKAFGVKSTLVADANGLSDAALIHPGKTLYIPVAGAIPPPGSGKHTVRRGESLWTISRRYGVGVDDLRVWNRLGDGASVIRPGQQLRVGTNVLTTRQRSPVGTDASGRPVHTVRSGESLWTIAQSRQVTVSDLRQWNGLANDTIQPGQRLYISAAPSGDVYTVVRGDTLYSIARRFGVDAADIARSNNMSLSSTLLTGMELRIPDQPN